MGCARHETVAPAAPPVRARAARFDAGGGDGTLILPGRIKASEEVTIRARLDARLTAFVVREGDRVSRGAVLARFDAPETRTALAAARAESDAAASAHALALRQHARAESLYALRVISSHDREVADADLSAARARASQATAALDALESGVAVRAPFDAVVIRRHVDAGADLESGTPLLDLRSASAEEAVADIPEGTVAALERGPLRIQSADGAWHAARLARLDGMTDFRSRTRTARLALPPGAWEPGAFARVAIGGTNGGAGVVPASSLTRRGSLAGVYVIESGRARLRWLRLGRESTEGVEVLAGLEPGEIYALDSAGLADGRAIEVGP